MTAARSLFYGGAAVVGLIATLIHFGATYQYVSLARLTDFAEMEPFRHRILVPALAHVWRAGVPGAQVIAGYAVVEWMAWVGLIAVAHRALVELQLPVGHAARRLLAFTIVWPAAVQLIRPTTFTLARADGLLSRPEQLQFGFARIGLGPNVYYPYDVPSMLLALALAVALLALMRQVTVARLSAYLGLFVTALLNKETAILMIPVSAVLLLAARNGRAAITLTVWQIALSAAVLGGVRWLLGPAPVTNPYSNLGVGGYEFHLLANLRSLARPLDFLATVPLFAGGLWAPLLVWRSGLDRRITTLLVWFVMPSMAAALCFGQLLEGRIFAEVVGVLWLAAVQVCVPGPRASAITSAIP